MPPGYILIVQMKSGKQNLERVYFYLRLCVFQFFCRHLINRIAVSIFVKKYGLHEHQLFIVPFLIFWRVGYALVDFKKSLGCIAAAVRLTLILS